MITKKITKIIFLITLITINLNTGKLRNEYKENNINKEFELKKYIDGKKLYNKYLCNTCHGESNKENTIKNYPKIFYQPYQYLIQQITDIKNKKRNTEEVKIMIPFVENLTEEEIKLISIFLHKTK